MKKRANRSARSRPAGGVHQFGRWASQQRAGGDRAADSGLRLAGETPRLCAESGERPGAESQRQRAGWPRERVVIVDVEDARLVLGVTAQQITHLHSLPPLPPEASLHAARTPLRISSP